MHSASIAEWMVTQCAGEKRAASIVGDLLELNPQKGTSWFWFSVAGIVLALVWRRLLAFIVAFYAGAWAMRRFFMAIFGADGRHAPPEYPWIVVCGVLCPIAALTLFLLVYAAICYGFRDRVTQLALVLTGLATAVIYFWRQPVILATNIVLGLCVLLASILSSERRRAALVLLAVVVVGFGGGLLTMYLAAQERRYVFPWSMVDREFWKHPSARWVYFCVLLIAGWMMTAACSRMHHWMMSNQSFDSETQPKSLS